MKTLSLLLLMSVAMVAQEHAPTVEQCRADAAVWFDADFAIPPMKELESRAKEMNDCLKVDPLNESHELGIKYLQFGQKVFVEKYNRLTNFIERHDPAWSGKFYAEDAAGKR
jgi:hypothetical protein